jgi:hypothetical protein
VNQNEKTNEYLEVVNSPVAIPVDHQIRRCLLDPASGLRVAHLLIRANDEGCHFLGHGKLSQRANVIASDFALSITTGCESM